MADVWDLTGEVGVTVALLADQTWRARVVETITVDRAHAMRAHRSLQTAPLFGTVLDPPESSVDDDVPQAVRLALPVGMLPKRTLVAFDVDAEGGPAYLLKRKETALRQAAFLCALAEQAGHPCSERVESFFAAICEFPPGYWQYYRTGRGRWRPQRERLRHYLRDGLRIPVGPEQIETWQMYADGIAGRLRYCLQEKPDPDSSSENVLLALPLLAARGLITRQDDVLEFLTEIASFVEDCATDDASPRVLQVLAEYGRRYPAMITCVVPTMQPTTIRFEQDFPLNVGLLGVCSVELPFSDAASNHVAIRVTDPDVELQTLATRRPDRRPLERGRPSFNLVRRSREDFALYGSEPDRAARIRVRFRLTLPWISKLTIASFVLLTLLALVLVLHLPHSTSDDLAVFVVPTTLAAGIVLGQQRTSLGMRLQRGLRILALTSILVLWAVVAYAYYVGWIVGDRA